MSMTAINTAVSELLLQQSHEYCARLTKTEARNFYYGLKLLPQPKRHAMFAVYAYMRLVDDISDDEAGQTASQRLSALDAWAQTTRGAINGQIPLDGKSLWPAFVDMVQRYSIPEQFFHDAIAGQRQDIEGCRFDTFQELRDYCYRVASVVGLVSIHIWGFDSHSNAPALAIDRGIAFQLTNILRDLREDAGRGRCYLPRRELEEAQITIPELTAGRGGPHFVEFMAKQIARAQSFYQSSAALEKLISPDARPTLLAMTEIYREILNKIERDPQRVLHERVRLSTLSKLRIAWRATRSRQWRE